MGRNLQVSLLRDYRWLISATCPVCRRLGELLLRQMLRLSAIALVMEQLLLFLLLCDSFVERVRWHVLVWVLAFTGILHLVTPSLLLMLLMIGGVSWQHTKLTVACLVDHLLAGSADSGLTSYNLLLFVGLSSGHHLDELVIVNFCSICHGSIVNLFRDSCIRLIIMKMLFLARRCCHHLVVDGLLGGVRCISTSDL